MDNSNLILVVDDQEAFREAIIFELETLGFNSIPAENGEDALDKFKNNQINLVISDIRMPVWDGRKFLNELRKSANSFPPFIFMSGFADLKQYEAYHEGADAFLGKPVNPDYFEEVVRNLLLPIEQRWSSPLKTEIDNTISFSENVASDIQIGRGGIFIPAKLDDSILDHRPNSQVNLNIKCDIANITNIRGSGKVAWSRSDNENKR